MRIAGINSTELAGGSIAIAIGGFAVWEASGYSIGQLSQMGPGYFPVALGVVMIGLGAALIFEGRRVDAEPAENPAWRTLVAVLAGIGAFALLLERTGLVPASVALVLLAALAEPQYRPGQTVLLALAVSAISVLIFSLMIGMPLPAFARWW
jgi:hypothetical protein